MWAVGEPARQARCWRGRRSGKTTASKACRRWRRLQRNARALVLQLHPLRGAGLQGGQLNPTAQALPPPLASLRCLRQHQLRLQRHWMPPWYWARAQTLHSSEHASDACPFKLRALPAVHLHRRRLKLRLRRADRVLHLMAHLPRCIMAALPSAVPPCRVRVRVVVRVRVTLPRVTRRRRGQLPAAAQRLHSIRSVPLLLQVRGPPARAAEVVRPHLLTQAPVARIPLAALRAARELLAKSCDFDQICLCSTLRACLLVFAGSRSVS